MKRWSGTHLRISMYHLVPFTFRVTDPATGREHLHGIIGAVLDNVTAVLNITYSIVPTSDGNYGTVDEENNKLVGMPLTAAIGDADIAAGPVVVHPAYAEPLHFVARIDGMYSTIMITSGMPNPYNESPTSFTEAFDVETWRFILAGYIAVLLVYFIHDLLIRGSSSKSIFDAFTKPLFEMYAVLLQEATSEKPPKIWFERFMRGLWLVACMLLSYTFLGAMRANLVVLTPTARIDDVPDLVAQPQLTIYYPPKTPIDNMIHNIRGEPGRRLKEHLKANSIGILDYNYFYAASTRDNLGSQRAVMVNEEQIMLKAVSQWCVECPYYFYFSERPIQDIIMCTLASRRLPAELLRDIDQVVLWTMAIKVPFMREWELRDGHLGCLAGNNKKTADRLNALELSSLNTVNASLLIGYAMAIVMYILEVVVYRTRRYLQRTAA